MTKRPTHQFRQEWAQTVDWSVDRAFEACPAGTTQVEYSQLTGFRLVPGTEKAFDNTWSS